MKSRKCRYAFAAIFSCVVFANVVFGQSSDEYEIFQLVNQERMRSRLDPLVWDQDLARLARTYSKKMAREGFFGHYDRDGKSVADRSRESGVGYWQKIGENLFVITEHPDYVGLSIDGWMRSASHRRNIRDRSWNATGIGIARSRDRQIYITQVFVRR